MPDGTLDNADQYLFFQDPDSYVGGVLWHLSRHPRASLAGAFGGIAWLVVFGWMGIEMGGTIGIVPLLVGLIGMFALFVIDEMAGDVRCARCGFRTEEWHQYCPSCGDILRPVDR